MQCSVSSENTFVLKNPIPILVVICGPTATGKSGLALELARRVNIVILSADSRQVYREFDIGTAKPTIAQQKQVPHYLIDVCDPTETLTVADYQQQAQALIAAFHSPESGYSDLLPPAPSLPFLVGGTGLYIRSIVQGLQIPNVAPQAELRSQLRELGQLQCYTVLQHVDPVSAQKIHPNDEVRTLRALEVFHITGKPISQQQGEHPPSYPILQIGLDCLSDTSANQPDRLTHRIQQRTEQMIKAGFVDEVEMLCRTYGADLPLLNTLGYQEIRQYLAGEISLEDATALTVLHTRQFAKRQRTWFRRDSRIEWFDADDPNLTDKAWERIHQFIVSS